MERINKSLFPKIAKGILSKLSKSITQDVVLYVKNGKYLILDYSTIIDEQGNYNAPEGYGESWEHSVIEFNYINEQLPTLKHIQNFLYNTFVIPVKN